MTTMTPPTPAQLGKVALAFMEKVLMIGRSTFGIQEVAAMARASNGMVACDYEVPFCSMH